MAITYMDAVSSSPTASWRTASEPGGCRTCRAARDRSAFASEADAGGFAPYLRDDHGARPWACRAPRALSTVSAGSKRRT